MNGNILKLSRFCTHDGPGIRTTVFLKGCPLSCIWCHNPESQKKSPEIMYDKSKCINCGACKAVCSCHFGTFHIYSAEKCTACGKCSDICPQKALTLYGKSVSPAEIFEAVKKDMPFYKTSGGGVTLSGGEPLFQADFSADILKQCKDAGIHTAIETCGFSDINSLKKVLKHSDLVLFDLKETDEERHRKYTGVSLEPIMNNLNYIIKSKIPFILRLPIIPGLNDRTAHFTAVKNIVSSAESCLGVEVMPYHTLGSYKYEQLQRDYKCADIKEPDT